MGVLLDASGDDHYACLGRKKCSYGEDGVFDAHGQVPTRGLVNTQRYALGAVFVYQLTLLHQHLTGGDLRVGLKPLLKAA